MDESKDAQPIDFGKLAEAYEKACHMDAPLARRLAVFEDAVRRYGAPFAETYDDLVARLESGNVGQSAPGPGDPMPAFLLPNLHGRLVSLDELLGSGPLIISLNRGHWCEYCGIELAALADQRPDIGALGAKIVSIMPERQESLRKVDARTGGAITLLSDEDNGYALSLGLAIWLGERVRKLYMNLGLRVDAFQGNEAWFVPVPATFVVGQNGCIAARFVDPDFRRRMEIDDIVAALKSLKGGA